MPIMQSSISQDAFESSVTSQTSPKLIEHISGSKSSINTPSVKITTRTQKNLQSLRNLLQENHKIKRIGDASTRSLSQKNLLLQVNNNNSFR